MFSHIPVLPSGVLSVHVSYTGFCHVFCVTLLAQNAFHYVTLLTQNRTDLAWIPFGSCVTLLAENTVHCVTLLAENAVLCVTLLTQKVVYYVTLLTQKNRSLRHVSDTEYHSTVSRY